MTHARPTIGPTVGGSLTELLSWRWLFPIDVGSGAAATPAAWTPADFDEPGDGLLKRLDLAALVGLALFLGSLEHVPEEGARDDWFKDGTIRIPYVVSLAGGAPCQDESGGSTSAPVPLLCQRAPDPPLFQRERYARSSTPALRHRSG